MNSFTHELEIVDDPTPGFSTSPNAVCHYLQVEITYRKIDEDDIEIWEVEYAGDDLPEDLYARFQDEIFKAALEHATGTNA